MSDSWKRCQESWGSTRRGVQRGRGVHSGRGVRRGERVQNGDAQYAGAWGC